MADTTKAPTPAAAGNKPATKTPTPVPTPEVPVKLLTGIPIPEGPSGNRNKFPFETMDLGAMFFVPNRSAEKFAPYAAKYSRKFTPKKFVARDITMKAGTEPGDFTPCDAKDPKAIVGCGCWRTV